MMVCFLSCIIHLICSNLKYVSKSNLLELCSFFNMFIYVVGFLGVVFPRKSEDCFPIYYIILFII